MNLKKVVLITAGLSSFYLSSCVTQIPSTIEPRNPANSTEAQGTGDIDSSNGQFTTESVNSYKGKITRAGVTTERVIYRFWSGEYPLPVIDLNSSKKGTTKISAYTTVRDLSEKNKIDCTVQNGLYNPWSKTDSSAISYYTFTAAEDYKVVKAVVFDDAPKKVTAPAGSSVINVVYGAEGYCAGLLVVGKTQREVNAPCDFFSDNKSLVRTSAPSDKFNEQWLYLKCQEKDSSGKNVKAFIQDSDLLKAPGALPGCPASYGSVQSAKDCSR